MARESVPACGRRDKDARAAAPAWGPTGDGGTDCNGEVSEYIRGADPGLASTGRGALVGVVTVIHDFSCTGGNCESHVKQLPQDHLSSKNGAQL